MLPKRALSAILSAFVVLQVPVILATPVSATSDECRIIEDNFTGSFGYDYDITSTTDKYTYGIVKNRLQLVMPDTNDENNWNDRIQFVGPDFDNGQSFVTTLSIKDIQVEDDAPKVISGQFMIGDTEQIAAYQQYIHIDSIYEGGEWTTYLRIIVDTNDGDNPYSENINEDAQFRVVVKHSLENMKLIMVRNVKYNYVKAYYQLPGKRWESIGKLYYYPVKPNFEFEKLEIRSSWGVERFRWNSTQPIGTTVINFDDLVVKKFQCE